MGGFWGTIVLFDTDNGEVMQRIAGEDYGAEEVNDLVWSPDGSQFASVDDGTIDPITVWDAQSFAPLYTLMPPWEERTSLRSLGWAADLVAASGWGGVFVWEAASQTLLWSAQPTSDGNNCGAVGVDIDNLMALSPDGRYLAVVTGGAQQGCDRIAVYDAHTGTLLHTYPGNGTYSLTRIIWSPDARYLASVAQGDTIVVWDTSLLPAASAP